MKEDQEYRLQTLLPAISIGLLTVAFILAKTGRDALFFQGKGLFQLPLAYVGIGLSAVPAAFIVVQAMKIWGYARMLLLISMTGALADLFIDFQFYAAASSAGMGSKGNTNFFANFYIMLNLGSLLLQLFAAPKIQDWTGLRGGLLILPLALLGGATFVTAVATAISRSVLKVTEGGLKASIHRSIWEQAFIPVESDERSFVKVFVDGIGARIAEGVGATLLLVWLMRVDVPDPSSLNTAWIAWTLLPTAAVWLILTQNLRLKVTQEPLTVKPEVASIEESKFECTRFPDQCPCTTEWGKGIA